MGRKPINPARKKKPISFTVTDEQRTLCEWAAVQLGISSSEMIGRLIQKEAKRISRAKKIPLPDTNPEQATE